MLHGSASIGGLLLAFPAVAGGVDCGPAQSTQAGAIMRPLLARSLHFIGLTPRTVG